ncbi:hypothetical protein DCO58_09310 [Helicobacter saguini]|uniref:Uncharacterized protein n=1 Tax=Helicobacter saguini TaxID=1548018 RepID=A0A347VP72_9HELI|nr:cache domain-containing protein [Helicobacter saguini]MWV61485.1 hypothetical protein [Helicobacter saguini]MWV67844.1 hypothetical protein [Helicobacter saguini]MWV70688.1 hypothetical protein [Helicobacter saguini]MWV72592.1 hypothetical protein [Helicobacter saguini]TLD94596.1 hypothetical protein LS64_005410 [Helicobacter saguini]
MNFYKNLKIGTKICLVIACVLVICVGIMGVLISNQTSKIISEESHKLLDNVTDRFVAMGVGAIESGFGNVDSARKNIDSVYRMIDVIPLEILESNLESMSDVGSYVSGSFIYLKNGANMYRNDPKLPKEHHFTADGGMLLVATDDDPENDGGVRYAPALPEILEYPAFKESLQNNKPAFGIPRRIHLGGNDIYGVTMTYPIVKNNQVVGVVGAFLNLKTLQAAFRKEEDSVYKGSRIFMLDSKGVVAIHPSESFLMKKLDEVNKDATATTLLQAQAAGKDGIYEYRTTDGVKSLASLQSFEIWHGINKRWAIITTGPEEIIMEPLNTVQLPFLCFQSYLLLSLRW